MTPVQAKLLGFIRTYQAEHDGVSPSFNEMKDALGLASKSNISRILDGLEAQRLIRRSNREGGQMARAIEISPPRLSALDPVVLADKAARRYRELRDKRAPDGTPVYVDDIRTIVLDVLRGAGL